MQCPGHLISFFHGTTCIFSWLPEIPLYHLPEPLSVFGPFQIAWDLVLDQGGDDS